MPVSNKELESTTALSPGSRVPPNSQRMRSRKSLLVAVALVVSVITVSTLAQSGVSKSIVIAQRHYLDDVTPVEEADVIFNGGATTPADHSAASTRTLELALGKELNELHAEKWPSVAAVNIAQLALYTRAQYLLLRTLESAPGAKRLVILDKQSTLLLDVEDANVRIL